MTKPQDVPVPLGRDDALQYTTYPKSVSLARRRAGRLVTQWGYPQLAADASLLLSELATNAMLHGCLRRGVFQARVTVFADVLRIAVSDTRAERVAHPLGACPQRIPGIDDPFGMGLLIVDTLASRWGIEEWDTAKTVWCELDL